MGLGNTDAGSAAMRLRLIERELKVRPRTGDAGRTATRTTPQAPLDLGMLDYIRAHVDEVIQHTRTHTPDAPDAPHDAGVYAWMREHTAHLQDERRQAGEALTYRQNLEHALKMGEDTIIRRHACPACGCWGLFWNHTARNASCVNRNCRTDTGHPSTWTLRQIAHHHITTRESTARRAT